MIGSIPRDEKKLSRWFKNRGIPTDEIAFYNNSSFLEAEQKDSSILEYYAAWVRKRKLNEEYVNHVRQVVPKMADILSREIARDGQMGTCVDASMMLMKMLEESGIWCYAVSGSLCISAPNLNPSTHFWMYDEEQVAGHVWVVAPPYEIVDVVLQTQPYERGEAELLPKFLVQEIATPITPTADEYLSPEILNRQYEMIGLLPEDIHFRLHPELIRPTEFFPSWEVQSDQTVLRYASGGITLSDAFALSDITSRRWNGLLAAQLYDDVIKPFVSASS